MKKQQERVLILCTGNSCRSQMAAGYMQYYAGSLAEVHSAGTHPAERVHEMAVRVMEEDGISIHDARPRSTDEFAGDHFDYIVTVCEDAAENIPTEIRAREVVRFHLPDPDKFEGSAEEQLVFFEDVREQLKKFTLKFVGKELLNRVKG